MDHAVTRSLVRTLLAHPHGLPWRYQDIGLMGLALDDRRTYRLHLWDPESCVGEPPVHDHPYDFTSTVVAGELVNTRFHEDPDGVEYHRTRYTMGDEDDRWTDTVRLTGTATTLVAGDRYGQRADELHDSRQQPGTVTVIRQSFRPETSVLTVCRREEGWVSGRSRTPTPDEVTRVTAAALAWF